MLNKEMQQVYEFLHSSFNHLISMPAITTIAHERQLTQYLPGEGRGVGVG